MASKSLIKIQAIYDAMEELVEKTMGELTSEEISMLPRLADIGMDAEKLDLFKNYFNFWTTPAFVAVPETPAQAESEKQQVTP